MERLMKDGNKSHEQDAFWLKYLITDNASIIVYFALLLFIGHRSFGWRDFGITPQHLFLIGIGGALTIWCGTAIVGVRLRNQTLQGLRDSGFTDDEIADLDS